MLLPDAGSPQRTTNGRSQSSPSVFRDPLAGWKNPLGSRRKPPGSIDIATPSGTQYLSHFTRPLSKSTTSNSLLKPVLKLNLETLKHLFFNIFDVGELAPTSYIAVFSSTLNLHNEFFHQPKLVQVFFPKMLFANVRSLFLPDLGSQSHKRRRVIITRRSNSTKTPRARQEGYARLTHTLDPLLALPVGCHTWRATGITIYLENDGRLEHAQQMTGQRTRLH